MDDVAARAGVSRATVSRAFNGGHLVSTRAIEAIDRAVAETGYIVNQHARSLASHRSGSVVFILGEPQQRLTEDPNFNLLLTGCTQALADRDLTLTLAVSDAADVRRYVTGGQVDGALVVSAHAGNPIIDQLRAYDVPLVVYGVPVGHQADVVYVTADDRAGARQMVRHLHDTGRRTIATIAGPPDTTCGIQRLAGWRDTLGRRARQRLIARGDFTCAGGQAAMTQLLRTAPDLDAVFVASDLMAAGAIAVLRRSGRKVPDDVAVGGFEDSAVATTVEPALTTVRRPLSRMSAEMVRLLLDLIEGRPAMSVTLPTDLIIRDST